MANKDFDDFISRKTRKTVVPEINWEAEKKEWLAYLDALYNLFEESLDKYVKDKKICISYDEIEITEEKIGTYKAKKMILSFGTERIILKPIGTFLIGAKGRVDMSGKKGSVKIALVDARMKKLQDHIKISVHIDKDTPSKQEADIKPEEINWEWKFLSAPPTYSYQPVNSDTIYSAIMELSND